MVRHGRGLIWAAAALFDAAFPGGLIAQAFWF